MWVVLAIADGSLDYKKNPRFIVRTEDGVRFLRPYFYHSQRSGTPSSTTAGRAARSKLRVETHQIWHDNKLFACTTCSWQGKYHQQRRPSTNLPAAWPRTQFWKHIVSSSRSTEAPATQLYVVSLVVLPTMEDPVSSRLCTTTALMLIPCTLNTTSHFVKVVATAEGLPSSLWCTDGAITGVSWPGLCGPAGTSP